MRTLWDFEASGILENLNEACERLAVLKAAGVDVPLYLVRHARETLQRKVVQEVQVELLEPVAEPIAPAYPVEVPTGESPELHSEVEPVSVRPPEVQLADDELPF